MKATIIGAGNIGRGFLGQLFAEAGAAITFVELNAEVVAALNARHAYDIRIVSDTTESFHVPVVRAVRSTDRAAVAKAIAEADVAATAVGVAALPAIAGLLALGIEQRLRAGRGPFNVVVCENIIHSGRHLAGLVEQHLPKDLREPFRHATGFATSVVSRMVPAPTEAQRREDPVAIAVEPYCILPVDAGAFVGEPPAVPGFRYVDNIDALEDQKAYTHNAGHCMVAYFGYARGHTYIWQATEDRDVYKRVAAGLDETSRALIARHGFDASEQRRHVEDLFGRYRNRALGDTVQRVARQPLRKLSPEGRLVGAARLALEYGIAPVRVVDGIVAALRYDDPDDEQARELQSRLAEEGVRAVLEHTCKLGPDEWLTGEIETRYLRAMEGTTS
ncbi:MAG: mannitol-1-phosphate 5-dehydrogenase [Verrucomicrobia bacterium]|nr:mannitol-1-phosphate 5-dehydrogenase [Verrucomicrobiota bacterium]